MCKQSRKFFNNRSRSAYSLWIFKCQPFRYLITWKTNILHIAENIVWKSFVKSSREHAKNIIDFEKEKNVTINKRRTKSHLDVKVCYICVNRILKKLSKSINYWTVRDRCHYIGKHRAAAHSICNLKFNVPNKTPVVFHNGSNYVYHFIIKELANKFKGKFWEK